LAKFRLRPNPNGDFFIITNLKEVRVGKVPSIDPVINNIYVSSVLHASWDNQSCQVIDKIILFTNTIK
jgi:hypothetical protein